MRARDLIQEIVMAPQYLAKTAATANATVGLEMEMCVPEDYWGANTTEDWDDDRSADSIEEIIDFFDVGEHNTQRDLSDVKNKMIEEYDEWFRQHMESDWSRDGREAVDDWVSDNEFDRQGYMENWLSRRDADDRTIAQVLAVDDSSTHRERALRLDREGQGELLTSPYRLWLEAYRAVQEHYEQMLDRIMDQGYENSWYSVALEKWEDGYRDDNYYSLQSRWLESIGITRMRHVMNKYELTWPYWVENSPIDVIATSFSQKIGRPVEWSTRYDGARRGNRWIVEPDGSLDPRGGDYGLEFISPPQSLQKLIEELPKVKAWADEHGCYTGRNYRTGLHVNVSVPGYDESKIDYVKLVVLLGDDYILREFGRTAYGYAKSTIETIRERADTLSPEVMNRIMQDMSTRLDTYASRSIMRSNNDRYVSVNMLSNRIEFRSPGGDYLSDTLWPRLIPTINRFVVVLDAVVHPDRWPEAQREYLKKLVKMFGETGVAPDIIKTFVEYNTIKKNPAAQADRFVLQAAYTELIEKLKRQQRERQYAKQGQRKLPG